MQPPVLEMKREQHSSRMLVLQPGTASHQTQETCESTEIFLDAENHHPPSRPPNSIRPPIPKRKTNTSLPMDCNHNQQVRRGFTWTALLFVFLLGFGIAILLNVYFDLTPTGKVVRRLSAVNIEMTESYRASTQAFSKQIKVLDAKINRLLSESEESEAVFEPKVKQVFDPLDVAICGYEGDVPQVCSPSGAWVWDPPLKENEWYMCETDDGSVIPCGFTRQPEPAREL